MSSRAASSAWVLPSNARRDESPALAFGQVPYLIHHAVQAVALVHAELGVTQWQQRRRLAVLALAE